VKVRWLSGNQTGSVEDISTDAAEHAVAFGSAELVTEEAPAAAPEASEESADSGSETESPADTGKRRRRKAE
jgi:hypothetical protein